MSLDATRWAWTTPVKKGTERLILLALADRAGEDNTCYPSIARLETDTLLDRKTVQAVLVDLTSRGVISDTGQRKGATGKVKVYRLIGVENRENNAKNGTVLENNPPSNDPENGTTKRAQKRDDSSANTPKKGTVKQSRKRDDSEQVMIPNFPSNDPENGTLNDPKNGTQNLSVNLSGNLYKNTMPEKTDQLDPPDWSPELEALNTRLRMAGGRAVDQTTLDQTLVLFNPHYEGQYMPPNKRLAKLVSWIRNNQQRESAKATLQAGTGYQPANATYNPDDDIPECLREGYKPPPKRTLDPVEQARIKAEQLAEVAKYAAMVQEQKDQEAAKHAGTP